MTHTHHPTAFCRVLGWSSMAGVVVVIVAYILNFPLARYSVHVSFLGCNVFTMVNVCIT